MKALIQILSLASAFAVISACNAVSFGPTVQIVDEITQQDDTSPPPSTSACKDSATLSWTKPTQRTDGSSLTNLAGYQIVFGNNSRQYTSTIDLNDPNLTSYRVNGLSPGNRYYFAMKSVAANGERSDNSNEVWLYLPLCN